MRAFYWILLAVSLLVNVYLASALEYRKATRDDIQQSSDVGMSFQQREYAQKCLDGVLYYLFPLGAAPAYDKDTKQVKKC